MLLNVRTPALQRPGNLPRDVICSALERRLVPVLRFGRPVLRNLRLVVSQAGGTAITKASRLAIPKSISEVDNGVILGFGADLTEDHPGFHDQEYKERRVRIANLARYHELGQPLPLVEYTQQETETWGTALRQLRPLHDQYACSEFKACLPQMAFREDQVPQLQDISDTLSSATGWRIRPVAGLLHPRDFLAGLAFKYFHSTQYMRHPSKPMYTPEPDVIHELIGHVPMLAHPPFADMVQQIGIASLGADEKTIWHLTKVYWYTVEFGVVREAGAVRAFGAGVLSSFGEMEWMAAGKVPLEPLDPFKPQPKMSYKDGYQQRYFVLESFDAGAALLRAYAASLRRPEVQALLDQGLIPASSSAA